MHYFCTWPVPVMMLVLIANINGLCSNATDLFKLSPEKRLVQLLVKEFPRDKSFANSIEFLDSVSVLSEQYHDDRLFWYVQLYTHLRKPDSLNFNSDESSSILKKCPFPKVLALYSHYTGLAFLEGYANYDKGLKLLLHAKAIFEKIGYEDLSYGGECLNDLGLHYFYSGYFQIAIKYWQRAFKQHFINIHYKVSVLNNIGLAYMSNSVSDYQQASKYFLMCWNLAKKYDKVYCPIALTYYGQALHHLGKSKEALPFLIYGYNHNPLTDRVLAAQSTLFVADAYLGINDLPMAKKYIELYEKAIKNIGPAELGYNTRVKIWSPYLLYYKTKANYLKRSGDFAKANFYRRSMLRIRDSLDKLTAYKVLDTSENIINTEKYFSDFDKIRIEKEKELTMRNFTIGLLLLLGLGTGYVINQRRLKLLKEKELLEKSQMYINQQVERRREVLSEYLQLVQDKTELLETVSGQLDEFRSKSIGWQPETCEIHEHIDTLLSSIILTENDWQNFRLLFEQVHPGFLDKLKGKYKDLTASEIRLAALTRLNVPTKEMAFMLNANKETIHTSRYRLRKKLGFIESDIDLEDLLENL